MANARIQVKRDTTANWDRVKGTFIPLDGELIVYTDYRQETYTDSGGQTHTRDVPAFKVGTGNAYLGDLAFAVVTPEEVTFWNNKLNLIEDITDEKLVFTRN